MPPGTRASVHENGMFGVELEFFILTGEFRPAFDSSSAILRAWEQGANGGCVCPEVASFQIEVNPGPWPLNRAGLFTAMEDLGRTIGSLKRVVEDHGLILDPSTFVPHLSSQDLENPSFFTQEPTCVASARYFEHRSAVLAWENGQTLQLHGDRVIGCINEIHIHVQHRTDCETLQFFNFLNQAGNTTCARFQSPITVNGAPLTKACTTMKLFEQANGEWNKDRSLRRVGFLPFSVHSFEEYVAVVDGFTPVAEPSLLDPFRAVYFWVRLRGEPGRLRVEFRPMEMSTNWQERVCHLADVAFTFQRAPQRYY